MRKALLHVLLIIAFVALASACEKKQSRLNTNPGGGGGGGGGDGGNGGSKPPPVGGTYTVSGAVNILGSGPEFKANLGSTTTQGRSSRMKAFEDDNLADFENTNDCERRVIGEIIVRHRANSPMIKRLREKSVLEVNYDILRGLDRKKPAKVLFSRIRFQQIYDGFIDKCNKLANFTEEQIISRTGREEFINTRKKIRELNQAEIKEISDLQKLYKQVSNRSKFAVMPNYIRSRPLQLADNFPNDKKYQDEIQDWHYDAINVRSGWEFYLNNATNFRQVNVAVIDTGVHLLHSDLRDNLLLDENGKLVGYDFISDPYVEGVERFIDQPDDVFGADKPGHDENPFDNGDGIGCDLVCTDYSSSFHGTHVAGTIAAVTNNKNDAFNGGVAGVALNAKIMPLRVLGRGGGSDYDVAQAILFAAGLPNRLPIQLPLEYKADVINLSLGGDRYSEMLREAVRMAYSAGSLIIAAAGNENSNRPIYPASFNEVIGVGAVYPPSDGNHLRLASYSNYGPNVDIVAPGGDVDSYIYSTHVIYNSTKDNDTGDFPLKEIFGDTYRFMSGTSMACPHVTGAAAMLLGYLPDGASGLNHETVRALLLAQTNRDDLDAIGGEQNFRYQFGNGMVDIAKAFEQIENAQGKVTKVMVHLETENGEKTELSTETDSQTSFAFSFSGVTGGTYKLVANADTDEDGDFDDMHAEQLIKVTANISESLTLRD